MSQSILAEPTQQAAQTQSTPSTPAAQSPNVVDIQTGQPTWRDSLSSEIKNDPSINKFTDIDGLAKSYIHMQKTLGVDKIAVPTAKSSQEEWTNVFKKLGLPETSEKYDVRVPEGQVVDKELFTAFKSKAFEAGILPQQAEKLLSWYNEAAGKAQEGMQSQRQQQMQKGVQELRQEWGEAWDKKVSAAKAAVEQFGGNELKEYLTKSGLGNDPKMIKLMSKIGESLTEGKIRGEGTGNMGMTPDEARAKINSIMSDFKHPYHVEGHADHKRAVDEMNRLFEMSTR